MAKGTGDIEANVRAFRKALLERPIDVQLLGIGVDGHVLDSTSRARCSMTARMSRSWTRARLTRTPAFLKTGRGADARHLDGHGRYPARKETAVARNGRKQADALKGLLLNEELDVQNPRTLVKTHPDATVIIDCTLADKVGLQISAIKR